MSVEIENVSERPVVAIRRRMRQPEIATGFRAPLDEVWRSCASTPSYVPTTTCSSITRPRNAPARWTSTSASRSRQPFAAEGEVRCVTMPAGRAATMHACRPRTTGWSRRTQKSQRWCAANGHALAGVSWEIYGHWNDDPSKLETRVGYLLQYCG